MISRSWLRIALANFLLAAVMGGLMRFAFVEELAWMKFRNVLHGHSHVAMLGWLYMALYACLIHAFLPPKEQQDRFYQYLFWVTQASVVGMLVTFPIQGYAAASITFSTLHVGCAYAFAYRFLKDLRRTGSSDRPSPSRKWVRLSIWLMLLSTAGLWLMGPIMVLDPGRGTAYYMAVQFYLHFQFNGWFLFAVLALFFRWLEVREVDPSIPAFQKFRIALLIASFPTYALALTWAKPEDYLFYLNGAGVLVQLAALVFFIQGMRQKWGEIRHLIRGALRLPWAITLTCFCMKIVFQAVLIVPFIAVVAYTVRNFVIGFFHLILLGIITHFVIGYALDQRLIRQESRIVRTGLVLLIAGFVLSETILFGQGLMFWVGMSFMPYYYPLLFATSSLMPIGILTMWIGDFRGGKIPEIPHTPYPHQ